MPFTDIVSRTFRRFSAPIAARRVLVPNAKTKAGFAGKIVGVFRRTGANAWDDYELAEEEGGPVEIFPGLKVQLERRGPLLRMRMKGEVVLVVWQPRPGELPLPDDQAEARALFMDRYVEPFAYKMGQGVTSFIARTLHR